MRTKTRAAGAKTRRPSTIQAATSMSIVKFEVSSYYENMLELRETKPEVFNTLSPAAQMTLEFYLKAKRAAQSEQG